MLIGEILVAAPHAFELGSIVPSSFPLNPHVGGVGLLCGYLGGVAAPPPNVSCLGRRNTVS
jgi:hypothetical protein